jgi:hypothetical protein
MRSGRQSTSVIAFLPLTSHPGKSPLLALARKMPDCPIVGVAGPSRCDVDVNEARPTVD